MYRLAAGEEVKRFTACGNQKPGPETVWTFCWDWQVDTSVCIPANDRAGLERLLRYCTRPHFALERLRKAGSELVDFGVLAPNSPLQAAVTAMAQAAPMTAPMRVPTAVACAVPEASPEVPAPPTKVK